MYLPGSGPNRSASNAILAHGLFQTSARVSASRTGRAQERYSWRFRHLLRSHQQRRLRMHRGRQRIFSRRSPTASPPLPVGQRNTQTPPGYQPPPFFSPSYRQRHHRGLHGTRRSAKRRASTIGASTFSAKIAKFLIEADYVGNRGHSLNSTMDLESGQSFVPVSRIVAATVRSPHPPLSPPASKSLREFPGQLVRWHRHYGRIRSFSAFFRATADKGKRGMTRRNSKWSDDSATGRSRLPMCGRSRSALLTYRQIFSQTQVYPQDMYNLQEEKSYQPV